MGDKSSSAKNPFGLARLSRKFSTPAQKLERICTTTGNVNKLEALLDKCPQLNVDDVRYGGWSPLHSCCRLKFESCVSVLVTSGKADVRIRCGEDMLTPLHVAALAGASNAVAVLIQNGGVIGEKSLVS
jgi:ankyrin repeat protein